jgi:IS30 family transposase
LVSQQDLDIIQFNLNHRPRKWLNFLSPAEAYAVALVLEGGWLKHIHIAKKNRP